MWKDSIMSSSISKYKIILKKQTCLIKSWWLRLLWSLLRWWKIWVLKSCKLQAYSMPADCPCWPKLSLTEQCWLPTMWKFSWHGQIKLWLTFVSYSCVFPSLGQICNSQDVPPLLMTNIRLYTLCTVNCKCIANCTKEKKQKKKQCFHHIYSAWTFSTTAMHNIVSLITL